MPYKTPELRRKNYLENKEKQLKQSAEYAKAHPESRRASYTKWATANPEYNKARRKKHYDENKEQAKIVRQEYLSNPENVAKVKASRKKYYEENREREIAKVLEWQKQNPEYKKAIDQNRRTQKTKAGGSFTVQEWVVLCEKYDYRCVCCHKKRKLTIDHIVPVSKGGTSNIENLQPLCRSCNSRKGTNTVDYRF